MVNGDFPEGYFLVPAASLSSNEARGRNAGLAEAPLGLLHLDLGVLHF